MKKITKFFFGIILILIMFFLFVRSLTQLKILYPSTIFYILLAAGMFSVLSFVSGILLLKKYFRTKRKLFLFLGIIFTFIVPGIYYYLSSTISAEIELLCYMPALFVVRKPSVKLLSYRKDLIKKFENKLPNDVISKITSQEN
jgi:hypothetical protein